MADEGKEGPVLQTEEQRARVLGSSSATGGNTATGVAMRELSGEREENAPKGEERGSTREIAGEPRPDTDPGEPQGAQAEPANYATNGSLPIGMVPSNVGLVPGAALGLDRDETRRRAEESLASLAPKSAEEGYRALTRAEIERATAPELRAIAHDRGYEMPNTPGGRSNRRAFIEAQRNDKLLKDQAPEGGEEEGVEE
jgi:hypothetical protein